MPGLAREGVATAFAGITGTVVTFVAAYGIGRLVQRQKAAENKG
jgi:hypothetical protein